MTTTRRQEHPQPEAPAASPRAREEGAAGLESLSRPELYREARRLGVPGRSYMVKAELLEAVRARS